MIKKRYQKFRLQMVKEREYAYNLNKVDSPEAFANELKKIFHFETQAEELVAMICLNTKGEIVAAFEISRGNLNTSVVHPREVFKRALLSNANTFLLAHNHPSGDPTPSDQDILLTRRILDAGKIMGVELVDHIIIGENSFVSLHRLGLI